jgi:hypothetical protein
MIQSPYSFARERMYKPMNDYFGSEKFKRHKEFTMYVVLPVVNCISAIILTAVWMNYLYAAPTKKDYENIAGKTVAEIVEQIKVSRQTSDINQALEFKDPASISIDGKF